MREGAQGNSGEAPRVMRDIESHQVLLPVIPRCSRASSMEVARAN